MPAEHGYRFGPFVLDVQHRRLLRDGEPLALSDRNVEILRLLASRAGHIVTKDALIASAWVDVAVGDNSLEQAISVIRRCLGAAPDGQPYIETLVRQGYRFRAPVATVVPRRDDDALAAALQPHRMFLEGRAAIETFERAAVERARLAFADVVAADGSYAPAHIGLANALALEFDAARGCGRIDPTLIRQAVTHAREACLLDVESGEAWATLAFVLSRAGGVDAVAAGRRATMLEPENWRHHLRLAYASWGDERLRAAEAAARRLPGFGIARWLIASVHVARGAFDQARRELTAGAAAQDAQPGGGRFSSVGLHLLLGLVHLAGGEDGLAEAALRRELSFEPAGHIYAPQACASAWSALGAIHISRGETHDAVAAFDRALERVPGHALSLAALTAISDGAQRDRLAVVLQTRLDELESAGAMVDAAVIRAVGDVFAGRPGDASARVRVALDAAPAGSAGWTIPVEPLLRVREHREEWDGTLAVLALRAA